MKTVKIFNYGNGKHASK